MPDTYRVKLSDGRTVRVTTSGGPPSEADVMAQLSSGAGSRPPAAAPPDDSFKFNPDESTAHAMARYAGNELLGLVKSPRDALMGLIGMPGAVWKGWTQDIPTLLRDPSLLTELPGVTKDALATVATHPEQLGSLLGQALIGKAVPATVARTPAALKWGGEFLEGTGSDIATHGLLKGLSKAAISPIVESTGRFVQRLGEPGLGKRLINTLFERTAPNRPVAGPRGPRKRWGSKEVPYQMDPNAPTYPRWSTTEPPPPPPDGWPGDNGPYGSDPGYPRWTSTEPPPAPPGGWPSEGSPYGSE